MIKDKLGYIYLSSSIKRAESMEIDMWTSSEQEKEEEVDEHLYDFFYEPRKSSINFYLQVISYNPTRVYIEVSSREFSQSNVGPNHVGHKSSTIYAC